MKQDLKVIAEGKTHIIFDFDKTLFWLDMEWDYFFDDISEHLKALNSDLFDSYMRDEVSWGDMQNVYVERYGNSVQMAIRENSKSAELRLLNRTVPNRDLLEFVGSLDKEVSLHIWSSNSRDVIEATLTKYCLSHRFQIIASRTDVAMLKPYTEGFSLIYDDIDKTKYLMVGDSDADQQAALAAGIDFYRVKMSLPSE